MQDPFKSAVTTATTSSSVLYQTQAGVVLGDQFRLERRLSSGGMGTVWAAQDLRLRRPVAIKFIANSEWDGEPAQLRFEREAVLAGKLRSPHVVQIFAQGRTEEGRPYIVMELLNGEDLANRIARCGALRRLPTLSILEQATCALSEAHRQGLVHRDIKPHNIFLVQEPAERVFVKLLDFGVAKDIHTPVTKLTLTGAFIGTLLYISPEQLSDPRHVGPSADIWGLAVTTYQMLTGVVPFSSSSALPQLLLKISRGDFVPATTANPNLPRSLDAVFQRAFRVNPDQRFPRVEDFSEAITDCLRGVTPFPRPAARRKESAAVRELRAPASATRTSRWYVRAVATIALSIVACLLWWFWQVSEPVKRPSAATTAQGQRVAAVLPKSPAEMTAPESIEEEALEEALPVALSAPAEPPPAAADPKAVTPVIRRVPAQPKAQPEQIEPQPTRVELVNYGF